MACSNSNNKFLIEEWFCVYFRENRRRKSDTQIQIPLQKFLFYRSGRSFFDGELNGWIAGKEGCNDRGNQGCVEGMDHPDAKSSMLELLELIDLLLTPPLFQAMLFLRRFEK